MKHLIYPPPPCPPVKEKVYRLPRKNILVISCMDLRLTDNLVDFLHFDNLQNRYDHFILAGSSLLCSNDSTKFRDERGYTPWKTYHKRWDESMIDHVDLAIKLHHIEDVYIVEHQDCGAYKEFLTKDVYNNPPENEEREIHRGFAMDLLKRLQTFRSRPDQKGQITEYHLNVHTFFIDLRGNVQLLDSTTDVRCAKEALV